MNMTGVRNQFLINSSSLIRIVGLRLTGVLACLSHYTRGFVAPSNDSAQDSDYCEWGIELLVSIV